jgi:hypothetical protein
MLVTVSKKLEAVLEAYYRGAEKMGGVGILNLSFGKVEPLRVI